jgi:hypothetical protein
MTPTCEPPSHLDQHVPNDRCWPKAEIQNPIIEAVPVSAPERLLLAESGRSSH